MPLAKKFLKTRPVCKVRFALGGDVVQGVTTVTLVGEFNDWDNTRTPLKQQKDGTFVADVELAQGQTYRFRYLLDGQHWANEPEADGYEFCPFAGTDNSLVTV